MGDSWGCISPEELGERCQLHLPSAGPASMYFSSGFVLWVLRVEARFLCLQGKLSHFPSPVLPLLEQEMEVGGEVYLGLLYPLFYSVEAY